MHVPQILMWWKIWKILQKILKTKQIIKTQGCIYACDRVVRWASEPEPGAWRQGPGARHAHKMPMSYAHKIPDISLEYEYTS